MSTVVERPLTEEEQTAFADCARQGLANLGLAADAAPEAVVQAVDSFLDDYRARQRKFFRKLFQRLPDSVDVAVHLGAVWGSQIVQAFGWEWTCLQREGDERYAVVSTDRAYAIFPNNFVKWLLEDPSQDNTILLLFNMVEAGQLPAAPPRAYEDLTDGRLRHIVPKGA